MIRTLDSSLSEMEPTIVGETKNKLKIKTFEIEAKNHRYNVVVIYMS
jgi:hypothetical protein